MVNIDKNYSDGIWSLKGIAILSIFFAHMPILESNVNYFWLERAFSLLGMFGVPVFFFLSGFLFKKGNVIYRTKWLLIPLVIWGTLTYSFHCIPSAVDFNIKGLLLWICGSNCYLYFVSVLISIILLFNVSYYPIFWFLVGVLSVFLTDYHYIPYTQDWTPYLNPFNFISYFSFGILSRNFDCVWKLICNRVLVIPLIIILVVFYTYTPVCKEFWYFNLPSFFLCIVFIVLSCNIIINLSDQSCKVIAIGKISFVIYLSHMQIATTLNKFLPRIFSGYLEPVKVIVAFIIATICVIILDRVIRMMKIDKIRPYIGFRG